MIPFLSVRPQAIKLKVKPEYPARLIGGTAISVSKANGDYTINLNISELQEIVSPGSNSYVVVWDSATGLFSRIKTGSI